MEELGAEPSLVLTTSDLARNTTLTKLLRRVSVKGVGFHETRRRMLARTGHHAWETPALRPLLEAWLRRGAGFKGHWRVAAPFEDGPLPTPGKSC